MAEHYRDMNPFAGLGSNSDDDEEHTQTDTFVSLDENYQPAGLHAGSSSLRTPQSHSQLSGMVTMDEDTMGESNARLVSETSAFVWSVGDSPEETPHAPATASQFTHSSTKSYSQTREPVSSARSETKTSEFFSSRTTHNALPSEDDFHLVPEDDEEEIFAPERPTPGVIRKQMSAIQVAAGASDEDATTVVNAVTSSTIPNFFKQANPYDNISNPSGNDATLVLFSRIGPVGKAEEEALSDLAFGQKNALARVVEMMAYTVEFQTHELIKLKNSDLDILEKSSGDNQIRWSQVDRRRSFCIRTLLDELDKKSEQISDLQTKLRESQVMYESERNLNQEIREQCEVIDPSIRFENGAKRAFKRASEVMRQQARDSEATVKKQKMEMEEYAERLLKLERKLADSQRRQDVLLQENTSLKVRLAGCSPNKGEPHVDLQTPIIHTNTEVHQIQLSRLEQEKSAISEEAEELRQELHTAQTAKREMEDKLFKNNIDLEEVMRKMKSVKGQLGEAEANVKLLKESHDHLEEHSRKVAKELSQNTVDAALELDKREIEVRQLRFELEDRESAMDSYRRQIKELENQIKLVTNESIDRGRAMANGDAASPGSANESSEVKESFGTIHQELADTRELLNEKYEEVVQLKASLEDMERSMKLAEEECEMWKNSAQSQTRDIESRAEDLFGDQNKQNETFLRRLSVQLNCHADNKRDLIRKLVERIEELITERVVLEEAKEKLSEQIVERQKMIHAISSEYESEISALKLENRQLEQSRARAYADRKAVEDKLDELAMLNTDGEFDDTFDATTTLNMSAILTSSTPVRQNLKFDEDDMDWQDSTINAAVKSVSHLVGNKMDLASRNVSLKDRLNKLLNGTAGVNDDGSAILSRDILMETREFNEELVTIIGQQQKTISKLRRFSGRRSTLGARSETAGDEDHSVSFSLNEETTKDSHLFDDDDRQYATSSAGFSPVVVRRQSKASAFLRNQLEEARAQYTEKMNSNTKLSTVIKDLEHKLEVLLTEKKSGEGRYVALSELHEKFVRNLGHMLNVRCSTVHVETTVRDLLSTVSSLETKHVEMRAIVKRQTIRVMKLGAQKRVFEHLIGIYQRKYHLNILAVDGKNRSLKDKFRSAVKTVIAANRLVTLAQARSVDEKPSEYMDVGKMFKLPAPMRIADSRFASIPMSSALLALRSNDKLRTAIAEREKEIADLRRTLSTLDVSVPISDIGNVDFGRTAGFDYSQEVLNRKSEIETRLRKVLQEKEELEVRLSHEKQHRVASETRAKEYLEKASKLHGKLQSVKLTAENRERTYKAAIRYLKQKADSALDLEFENTEPNTAMRTPGDSSNAKPPRYNIKNDVLQSQLREARENFTTLEKGTKEYNETKTYILGLQNAIQKMNRLPRSNTSRSVASSSSRMRVVTEQTETRHEPATSLQN